MTRPAGTTSLSAGRRIWRRVRRIWVISGVTAAVVFIAWSLLAYRATPEARRALASDPRVDVHSAETHWAFAPRRDARRAGLVFFPGALVDPVAYAPLARAVAEAGYPVLLVRVPRRGAFGGADGPEVLMRALDAMRTRPDVGRWVVSGHSRGGAIASRFAHEHPSRLAGLVLIGTSHPRDFSLSDMLLPVTRIYGTRDTIADVEKLERTRRNLPESTREVRIEGGNHSQFAHYGFQPGDWPAAISRAEQQRVTAAAVLSALEQAGWR